MMRYFTIVLTPLTAIESPARMVMRVIVAEDGDERDAALCVCMRIISCVCFVLFVESQSWLALQVLTHGTREQPALALCVPFCV